MILTIGFCSFVIDFALDLEQELHQLNCDLIGTENEKVSTAKWNTINSKLTNIIKFHSEATE